MDPHCRTRLCWPTFRAGCKLVQPIFFKTRLRLKVGSLTLRWWTSFSTPRGWYTSSFSASVMPQINFAQAWRAWSCSVCSLVAGGGLLQRPPLRPGLRCLHGAVQSNIFSAHDRPNSRHAGASQRGEGGVPEEGDSPYPQPGALSRCCWTPLWARCC